ncbi:MAG: hypothetical protein ACFFED_02915 [Candidatus Thorarchaeota archaeon]
MFSESEDFVEPIHAESFFSVSHTGEIHERLCFEYLDLEGHYRQVTQDESLLEKEITKLASNMQYFLDEERVEINGDRVKSIVRYTDIFLKGSSEVVAVVYLIDFAGRFQPGGNNIQTWLEEENAPYDFEIIWRFPYGTQVVEIDSKLEHEIYNDFVVLWALEGDRVGGYELMEFILPESKLDTRIKMHQ